MYATELGGSMDGTNTQLCPGRADMSDELNRRSFLQAGAVFGVVLGVTDQILAAQRDDGTGLPKRPLGKTEDDVSILSLGGWQSGN